MKKITLLEFLRLRYFIFGDSRLYGWAETLEEANSAIGEALSLGLEYPVVIRAEYKAVKLKGFKMSVERCDICKGAGKLPEATECIEVAVRDNSTGEEHKEYSGKQVKSWRTCYKCGGRGYLEDIYEPERL